MTRAKLKGSCSLIAAEAQISAQRLYVTLQRLYFTPKDTVPISAPRHAPHTPRHASARGSALAFRFFFLLAAESSRCNNVVAGGDAGFEHRDKCSLDAGELAEEEEAIKEQQALYGRGEGEA